MDKFNRPVTPQERGIAGYSALIAGAGILAVGAGLVPRALDGMRAPLWVILAAGGVFALAGVSILLRDRAPAWVLGLLANVLLTLFAAIPAWIAWGDGQGQFSGSGVTLAWLFNFDGQAFGRFAFAAGAILMGTIAAAAWWKWFTGMDRRKLAGVVPALGLAGYALFVLVPAEPRWPDVHDDHERLARYAFLSEQEGWLGRKGSAPASWYFPPWRNFEHWTKAARSRLAASRVAPQDAEIRNIPISERSPVMDGRFAENEWQGALRIALSPESLGSSVLLISDGKRLFLAADAPADTTETGYDQFRFWFHMGLSPWLDNERALLGRGGHLQTLRALGAPQESKKPKWRTNWRIYERVHGATLVDAHRRYELQIDLEEAGINAGVAFPARLEIEGDPLRNEAGRFEARTSMGEAGSRAAPIWLRVGG